MYVIHIECFPIGFPLQGNGSKSVFTLHTDCSKQECSKTNYYWSGTSVLSVASEIANISNCMQSVGTERYHLTQECKYIPPET